MLEVRGAELLEREDELRELDRAVDDACDGRGSLVLIEGPPGIGKTRLLDAARGQGRSGAMRVLSGRASELDRDFPFGVIRQLFEPLAGDEGLLGGAAAIAAPLLRGEASDAGASDPRPLFHGLYWLVANLAEREPLMLAVDDLHWADTSSQHFLQFLAPRLEELRVLVAIATRAGEPGHGRQAIDALATDPLAVVLRPRPLSREAVASLVGEAPDESFSAAVREATGGNPFLVRELARELEAEGIEPHADREALVRQLAPPTVARAVLLRLVRLGEDAVALARAVAVLGDGAPLRRARELAELTEERAEEAASALARADLFGAGRPLAFAHPILRAAVHADMDAAALARTHRRAAALLAGDGAGSDAVAVHLLASEPSGDPAVVATLRAAAASALGRGAATTAVTCLRRALDEPPRDDRADVLVELASAEVHAGEPAAAVTHYEAGERLVADPRLRAGWVGGHAVALQAVGRNDDARALVWSLVEELNEVDRALALSVEASLIAGALLERSRRKWARERLESHRGRLTGATAGERKLIATLAQFDAFSGDRPADELADKAERALAGGGLRDEASGRATPFYCAVNVLLLADRIAPARAALDEAIHEARRRSSTWLLTGGSGWRCWLLARTGDLAEAEADARTCAELGLPHGSFAAAPPMLGFVLDVLIDRGEVDDAQELLERAGLASRRFDGDASFDPIVHARARLRAARGDVEGGRADLDGLLRRRSRWNTYPTLVPASLAAPSLVTADELARAERMLREADTWGTPRAIGMAMRAAALARGADLDLLAGATAVLARSPARLEHAHAMTDLGVALLRAGRRGEAREELRRALDLADACGARPLAERARQELRAAGGRPRRARLSGADSLTASERRIAMMAADGMSNPEIAQALFVTKKTVEAHLGGAYRKLGINSRAQLGAALGD